MDHLRTFGTWREDGPGRESSPSLLSWPRHVQREPEALVALVAKLQQGTVVVVGQVGDRRCPLCAVALPRSRAFLTNGRWLWPDDLEHHVEAHGIALPKDFEVDLLAGRDLARPAAYTFLVEEVFSFADGTTVFVGRTSPEDSAHVLAPAEVELFVDGRPIERLLLTAERAQGHRPGVRAVETQHPVDPTLRSRRCVLVHRPESQ